MPSKTKPQFRLASEVEGPCCEPGWWTPRLKHGPRILVHLDVPLPRGRGWKIEATDLHTGRRLRIKAAPCSIPTCYCDAVAEEIE